MRQPGHISFAVYSNLRQRPALYTWCKKSTLAHAGHMLLNGRRTRNNLDKLVGDDSLALTVVQQAQLVNHLTWFVVQRTTRRLGTKPVVH